MRLAVLGDIHGNIAALEAVLRDAATRDVDGLVHLGDLVGDQGPSAEVIRRVRAEGIPGVAGDRDLAALLPGGAGGLREEELAFLRELPAQIAIHEGEVVFLFAHASPRGPEDAGVSDLPEEELGSFLEACRADVLVAGHTHRPLARQAGERLFLNPGSVCSPGDGDPRPSYLVLDTTTGLEAAHVRVQIAVERTRP